MRKFEILKQEVAIINKVITASLTIFLRQIMIMVISCGLVSVYDLRVEAYSSKKFYKV